MQLLGVWQVVVVRLGFNTAARDTKETWLYINRVEILHAETDFLYYALLNKINLRYSEREILEYSDVVTAVKQHLQLREAAADSVQSDQNLSLFPGLVLLTLVNSTAPIWDLVSKNWSLLSDEENKIYLLRLTD